MLSRLDLRGRTGPLDSLLPRPRPPAAGPVEEVRAIIEQVRTGGDRALIELTRRFDGVELESLTVSDEAVSASFDRVPEPVLEALETAAINVAGYQTSQMPALSMFVSGGISVETQPRPVSRAGCYAPGGRAVYPSTVIMTAVPARVAEVNDIALAVPPAPDGTVPDVVLAAAAMAGVDRIHPVGGAQAVAALAYGTESVAAVDVIAGPGSVYVALAMREVAGTVGVPSAFAGPSEVVVVADAAADPELAAIDVIVQAEHGPGGLAWLVTWEEETAEAVSAEVARLAAAADRSGEIAATLESSGYAVVCESPEQAVDVVNLIAPEHLELQVADPEALLKLVRNAGAVFCGRWSPASLGDYVAGPSHVLPTNGTARFAGALGVRDFMKDIHVITAERDGLEEAAPHVIALAGAEGLTAHADSVRLRTKKPGRRPPRAHRSSRRRRR